MPKTGLVVLSDLRVYAAALLFLVLEPRGLPTRDFPFPPALLVAVRVFFAVVRGDFFAATALVDLVDLVVVLAVVFPAVDFALLVGLLLGFAVLVLLVVDLFVAVFAFVEAFTPATGLRELLLFVDDLAVVDLARLRGDGPGFDFFAVEDPLDFFAAVPALLAGLGVAVFFVLVDFPFVDDEDAVDFLAPLVVAVLVDFAFPRVEALLAFVLEDDFFAVLDFLVLVAVLRFRGVLLFLLPALSLLLDDLESSSLLRSGKSSRDVDAKSSSCSSDMPVSVFSPARFLASSAPINICCAFDFAGIPISSIIY